MGFTQRKTAPGDTPYYKSQNPFAQSGYGMPNCTCYAWGRAYEIMGSRPKLSTGNAENWYCFSDGYQRGQTPRVGAIACWRKGSEKNSSDGAGHVAVVEEILADGSITTSESGWKSPAYWWRKTRKGINWGQDGAYSFQGFIYLPISSASSDTDKITGLPVLRYGSKNPSVKAIQILLNGYGFDSGAPDSVFGTKTKNAVMAFQKKNGLSVDGVCGAMTWSFLLGRG